MAHPHIDSGRLRLTPRVTLVHVPREELAHRGNKLLRRRLAAKQQMPIALERKELRPWNRSRDVTTRAHRDAPVAERVNHQRRNSDVLELTADVDVAEGGQKSRRVLG